MNMVCPNEGKLRFLAWCFGIGGAAPGDVVVELYKNNYTPVDASTAADFTPATFGGSGPITITPADWGAAAIAANVAQTDADTPPQWTCTSGGPETVYGWFMIDDASGDVLLAQRFDDPRVMELGAIEILAPFRVKLKTLA